MRPLIPFLLLVAGCPARLPPPTAAPSATVPVGAILDAWHAAAAASDLDAYFRLMTEDAIFLGTDATERWDVAELRAYAEPPFSEGRGWVFEVLRRDVVVQGDLAWFDEDLRGERLGPARGSGVLRREDGRWRIAHYNLALTVPNERFDEVRRLLDGTAPNDP
jgi:ketosteroid isomerase-like protein